MFAKNNHIPYYYRKGRGGSRFPIYSGSRKQQGGSLFGWLREELSTPEKRAEFYAGVNEHLNDPEVQRLIKHAGNIRNIPLKNLIPGYGVFSRLTWP